MPTLDCSNTAQSNTVTVYVCEGRKQEFSAVLARAIGSMMVHTSIRAAARQGADYVKGTGER